MITVESKVIVGKIRDLRVILSSLVLEELGKRSSRITQYHTFRGYLIRNINTTSRHFPV